MFIKNFNIGGKFIGNFPNLFKNFQKNSFNIISQISIFKFSTITLKTREGVKDRSENKNFNINLNWELAKIWVNPHNNSYSNTETPNKNFVNDTQEVCKIVSVGTRIQQMDFER